MTGPTVRREREILAISAVLLPFTSTGEIDWPGLVDHLQATVASGLVPAVNMDTGFGPVLSAEAAARVLRIAEGLGVPFVAGAHVPDVAGAAFALTAYRLEFERIAAAGGTPILFPSHGLSALGEDELLAAHRDMARDVDAYYGFELGPMFHPAGRIFTLQGFGELLADPKLIGLKHSSLDRASEWDRITLRDRLRPEFRLLTGNDLAIDMVIYGSDYLLGLSTFAPEAFAARDAAWASGDDRRFWVLNDVLQYLGQLAFRAPVPAYRHDAAMFLKLRGRISSDTTHPTCPQRPPSERQLLAEIARRLEALGV